MSDKAEVEKVARQLAERFAETGERPRQQIERMAQLMGPAWIADVAEQASREITAAGPLTLRVVGDGFLRHMVRAIAGTLVDVGLGRWPADHVARILASRDRAAAGRAAPPTGLFLVTVGYRSEPL